MGFRLPDKITIWNVASDDGNGVKTWLGPFPRSSRNVLKVEKFTDSNGDDHMSTAVCYTKALELQEGSIVFLGESSDSEPVNSANDARKILQIPSGAGDLKKVWFS